MTQGFFNPGKAQLAGLTTASVSGPFFFRHLEITTDTLGNITGSQGALGTMIFDGAGHYTLNAQQTVNAFDATALTGQGTYSIGPSGAMAIGNPQRNSLTINARVGTEAIVGSTTESGDNTFDLFIAVPAANGAQAANGFSGTYFTSTLEFPLSSGTYARSAFFAMTPNSSGFFSVGGSGHALNVNAGQVSDLGQIPASYALGGDGTASISFGSVSSILSGLKTLFISASGNIVIGGSMIGGAQDFLVGVRGFSGTAGINNWTGLYYTGGLRYDAKFATTAAYVGAWNALPSLAEVATYQREHQIAVNPFDYTSYQPTALNTGGTYADGEFNTLGLGNNGTSFADADVATQFDNAGFSLDFGIAAIALAGTGVYINPQGVLNGAGFSPTGQAIAPGEFVSLFGSGLAAAETVAKPPYPVTLGGVGVTVNGIAAPIYLVSAGQVNFLVPYAVSGGTATIVVTNGGQTSNSVVVPLSTTAPGVFTLDSSGTGLGAILHSNNTVVNSSNPARAGETVQIFATGLGAVSPAVADGMAGGSNPVSQTVEAVAVTIGGQAASVLFAGLAPGLPGLYQINVQIPKGLSGTGNLALLVQTAEALDEQADIAIH